MKTWLICGGRHYAGPVAKVLYDLVAERDARPDLVIHGNAPGADTLGGKWAYRNGIKQRIFQADWIEHGRAAGPIRNQRMIDEGKPDLVIAFPGGRGTADMVRRARKAGIEVVEIGSIEPSHPTQIGLETEGNGGGRDRD